MIGHTEKNPGHRILTTDETPEPFAGCVAEGSGCKPGSHGDKSFLSRCVCGATKRWNANGKDVEQGPWVEPVAPAATQQALL